MMGGVIVLLKMQNTKDLPVRLYEVLTYEVMEAFLVVALKTQRIKVDSDPTSMTRFP
jgi:hypothetical protein